MSQNQHYISKCLTRPWELNGTLYFFDFETQKIESDSSKKLFAKSDLWSPNLEVVFNNRFERHLRAEIINFMKGVRPKPNTVPYRHIVLMHFFNAMRGMKAHHDISKIEQFASLSNKELDAEMAHFLRDHTIVGLPIDPVYRLFFPESGFFSVPLQMTGSSEMELGFAIPLSTSIAFGLFPKGYNRAAFVEAAKASETYFLKLSVGIGDRRLIVHPDLVHNEPDLIEKILMARSENRYSAQLVRQSSESLQNRIDEALRTIKTKALD